MDGTTNLYHNYASLISVILTILTPHEKSKSYMGVCLLISERKMGQCVLSPVLLCPKRALFEIILESIRSTRSYLQVVFIERYCSTSYDTITD